MIHCQYFYVFYSNNQHESVHPIQNALLWAMRSVGAAHVGWTERWCTGDIGGFGTVNEKNDGSVCEKDDYFAMTAQELSTSTIGSWRDSH